MKMNSRMGRVLPDVEAFEGPLLDQTLEAISALGTGRLSPDAFLDETRNIFDRAKLASTLANWIDRALAEQADQILYRKTIGGQDFALQLVFIEPREVHPPHAHHDVISTQLVVLGQVHGREYERIRRRDATTIEIKLLTDAPYRRGDAMQSTDHRRNAHWFAAAEEPAVMLNFNVRGYHPDTFDPRGRMLGRRLIDPTAGAAADGTIAAVELEPAAAYAKFGEHPLTDFPPTAPPQRNEPFVSIKL